MDEAIVETGAAAMAELAASTLSRPLHCANCGTGLHGRFCSTCGQSTDSHRRSVRHLLTDLFKDIASFDSRILRTAYALLAKPGELALAFRDGRTQRYVPPIRLYLFVSLIFFLAMELSNIAIFQFVVNATPLNIIKENGHVYSIDKDGDRNELPMSRYGDGKKHYNFNSSIALFKPEGAVHSKMSPEAMQRLSASLEARVARARNSNADFITKASLGTMVKLAKDPAALNGALTAWIPRALFLLLPTFALILALFYWRQRKSLFFVDHLVFSLGFHTFGFVLLLFTAALAQVIEGEIAVAIQSVALSLYLLFSMKRFYQQSWLWTGIKWFCVLSLYTCMCVFPAFGLVIAASVFWG